MLKEKISETLGVAYVYLKNQKKFLCSTGVLISLEEFKTCPDIIREYETRLKGTEFYDYEYAKETGLLRRKLIEKPKTEPVKETMAEPKTELKEEKSKGQSKTLLLTSFVLLVTSVISGYISTLHTATYLYDYVDTFSAWLMSASVTAYNATAFEVSVIFKQKRRYGLTFVFIILWLTVTLFSMATTVSVFYDRYELTENQLVQENRQVDSVKISAQLLQKKEEDLRQAIDFKKKDIEYRQAKMYSTNAVRKELQQLEEDLQKNLSEQQELLSSTPEAVSTETKKKESLFSFLGRVMNLEGGILEFIMSTLSAIFVNIICPMSLVAVAEISHKTVDKLY